MFDELASDGTEKDPPAVTDAAVAVGVSEPADKESAIAGFYEEK
jgi:hypothetical protein